MPDDTIRLSEMEIDDLWRFRQEHDEAAKYHGAQRKAADKEVLRRAAEDNREVLASEHGDITITTPDTYSYAVAVVENEFLRLIKLEHLEAQWNQFVSHSYKIDRRWLNRLMKRGRHWLDVIDKMTQASTGSPTIKGPALADLGEYAPREGAQE